MLFGKSALVGWLLLDATFGAVNLWRLFQPNERRVFGPSACGGIAGQSPRSASKSRLPSERLRCRRRQRSIRQQVASRPASRAVALRVSLPGTYDRPGTSR